MLTPRPDRPGTARGPLTRIQPVAMAVLACVLAGAAVRGESPARAHGSALTNSSGPHASFTTVRQSRPWLSQSSVVPAVGPAAAQGGPVQETTIAAADRFVDSVGINVHLHYNGTLYREHFELTRQRLAELGVRYYRDILVDTAWQPYYERHAALGADGLRGTFIMQHPHMPVSVLREFPARVGAAFAAYEAPNELDNKGDPRWPSEVREALQRLRSLKAFPEVAPFPVVGPSLAFTDRHVQLGDVSALFDFGNLHNYFGGRNPGTIGWGVTDRDYGSYAWHFRFAQQHFGGRPIVTTETGYSNDPRVRDSVPEEIAARYLPRILLEQFRRGIVRTYIYELADEPGRQMHGLLRQDGTPKPAFHAVSALLSLLADPGPAEMPEPLRYTVTGARDDVRFIAFQKRDGRSFLAVWIEQPGYDVLSGRMLSVAPHSITVTAENAALEAIHHWRPDGSVQRFTGDGRPSATVVVTDALQILEFRPS